MSFSSAEIHGGILLFYWYPILISTIGVGIHLFGVLELFQLEVPRSIHGLMLLVDSLVLIGLLQKSRWGYWLALLLYLEQSIMQPYWAYQAYLAEGSFFQFWVASPVVIIALLVLASNHRLFVR